LSESYIAPKTPAAFTEEFFLLLYGAQVVQANA